MSLLAPLSELRGRGLWPVFFEEIPPAPAEFQGCARLPGLLRLVESVQDGKGEAER